GGPETEGPGLSDQPLASRQILHAGGYSPIRSARTLVLSQCVVFAGWEPAGDDAAVCGRSRRRADGQRVARRAQRRSQRAVVAAASQKACGSRADRRDVCVLFPTIQCGTTTTFAAPNCSSMTRPAIPCTV